MIVQLLLLGVGALLVYKWLTKKHYRLPPGPKAYPIVGNLHQLMKGDFFDIMREWRTTYGDTFSFRIGNSLNVVLSDVNTAKKVFNDDTFTGRDTHQVATEGMRRNGILHGLISSEGDLWKEQRRFALSTLRDLGMGKSWLEEAILAEVDDLCQELKRRNGEPFSPKTSLSHSISNVICAMVFGKRFEHSDERFPKLVEMMNETVKLLMNTAVIDVMPFMKYIPGPPKDGLKAWEKLQTKIFGFIKELIDENQKRPDQNGNYVQKYLEQSKQPSSKTFTDFQLLASCYDLFTAGTETTATTISWMIVYMIENPNVLRKCREEIREQLVEGALVRLNDKNMLPFTEATILEVQRISSTVGFSIPHLNSTDATIDGYEIPKGTTVFINIHAVHHDARNWEEPEVFRPERFLDKQGKVTRPDGFVPFSVGKRSCVGEALAKMELWLFVANLINRFDFVPLPNKPVSSKEYERTAVRGPKPYEVRFVPRGNW